MATTVDAVNLLYLLGQVGSGAMKLDELTSLDVLTKAYQLRHGDKVMNFQRELIEISTKLNELGIFGSKALYAADDRQLLKIGITEDILGAIRVLIGAPLKPNTSCAFQSRILDDKKAHSPKNGSGQARQSLQDWIKTRKAALASSERGVDSEKDISNEDIREIAQERRPMKKRKLHEKDQRTSKKMPKTKNATDDDDNDAEDSDNSESHKSRNKTKEKPQSEEEKEERDDDDDDEEVDNADEEEN